MTLTEQIENTLKEVFQRPIVRDITQTKIENVIAYRIDETKINHVSDYAQHLECSVILLYRGQNGYDSFGFMTGCIERFDKSGVLHPIDSSEVLEYINTTEIVISKIVRVFLTINQDKQRETIQQINIKE